MSFSVRLVMHLNAESYLQDLNLAQADGFDKIFSLPDNFVTFENFEDLTNFFGVCSITLSTEKKKYFSELYSNFSDIAGIFRIYKQFYIC